MPVQVGRAHTPARRAVLVSRLPQGYCTWRHNLKDGGRDPPQLCRVSGPYSSSLPASKGVVVRSRIGHGFRSFAW